MNEVLQQIIEIQLFGLVSPDSQITVPVFYDTANGDNTLVGIGIRIHFDSTSLTFSSADNLFSTNLFGPPGNEVTVQDDTDNYDGNANTDKYISINYLDTSGNNAWPGSNTTLPLKLVDLVFITSPDFQQTEITTTRVENLSQAGYGFVTEPLLIDLQNAPVFTSPASFDVAENTTVVGTVTATDPEVDVLSYTLSGGADQALFNLDANGALTFIAAPDFEAPADEGADNIYNIQVQVNDGANTAIQDIAIAVTDVDENVNPQQAIEVQLLGSVSPDSQITVPVFYDTTDGDNTLVGIGLRIHFDSTSLTFSSADNLFSTNLFGPPGNEVTVQDDTDNYDGNANTDKYISINYLDTSGNNAWPGSNTTLPLKLVDLVFTTSPDFQQTEITATRVDSLSQAGYGFATEPLLIDLQNAPVFTSPASFDVAENTTAVGTITATDPEVDVLTYTLSGGVDQALFNLDANGSLTFIAAPDFEAPADEGADNIYNIQVQVSDGTNNTTQNIDITVTDVNEEAPNTDPEVIIDGSNVSGGDNNNVIPVPGDRRYTVMSQGGDDTIQVDTAIHVITELPSGGTDTIESSTNFNLAGQHYIENLTLTGTENINAIGNRQANRIQGNSGQNRLTGLQGIDTFVFAFGDSSISAPDRIRDFELGVETIDIITEGGTIESLREFSNAGSLNSASLGEAVASVFVDADIVTPEAQPLGIYSGALMDITTTGIAGRYLVINDGVEGFQATSDLVIDITSAIG